MNVHIKAHNLPRLSLQGQFEVARRVKLEHLKLLLNQASGKEQQIASRLISFLYLNMNLIFFIF